jgi:hypothetical protein
MVRLGFWLLRFQVKSYQTLYILEEPELFYV